MSIDINGVMYEKIPPRKPTASSRTIERILLMGKAVYGSSMPMGTTFRNKFSHLNVVEEFKFVDRKISTLSRSERDYVTRTFNRNYVRVEQSKS